MSRLSVTVSALALVGALASNPAEAVQRSFVASFGSDANVATNCNFANPCRGFTAALGVTDPGGEVVALDAAGYGAVTITKSVTLTANPGFYAGISASTGNAVTIATAGIEVILRGLNLNGIGGSYGVIMTNGNKLSVENCVISRFGIAGIAINAPSATVRVVDSLIRENGSGVSLSNQVDATISGSKFLGSSDRGIYAFNSTSATSTTVAVSNSVISGNFVGMEVGAVAGATARGTVTTSMLDHNGYGFAVDGGAGTIVGTIGYSMVTLNGYGLYNFGSTLESLGNNIVRQNSVANTNGTITTVPGN